MSHASKKVAFILEEEKGNNTQARAAVVSFMKDISEQVF